MSGGAFSAKKERISAGKQKLRPWDFARGAKGAHTALKNDFPSLWLASSIVAEFLGCSEGLHNGPSSLSLSCFLSASQEARRLGFYRRKGQRCNAVGGLKIISLRPCKKWRPPLLPPVELLDARSKRWEHILFAISNPPFLWNSEDGAWLLQRPSHFFPTALSSLRQALDIFPSPPRTST